MFTKRSSRVVHEAAFLRIREDEIEDPDGEVFTRFTVEHPGAVAVVAVDGEGRVVLVRQYRVAADRELLEAPAGKREPDEPPEVTARRELIEEVGLEPGRLVELGAFYNSPGFCTEFTHVYLALDCTSASSDFSPKAEERHMSVERLTLAEVEAAIAKGEIMDAKTIVGLSLARPLVDARRYGPGRDA